jgi:glycerol-3-phosphate cytidylyltransferase
VIGYTTGVFDLFHVGHLAILQRASRQCDYLIVGVSTDELAEQMKGRRPVVPLVERMEIIQSLRVVDHVVPQVNLDKAEAWRNLRFDVVFVGDDWKGTDRWTAFEHEFSAVGVNVVYFPYTRTTSSTLMRQVSEEWQL